MPQLNVITIKDGKPTPADRTFTPVSTDGTRAQLAERVGVPVGYQTLETMVRPPVNGNGLYRITLKMKLPTVVQDASGVSKLDTNDHVAFEFVTSERSTEQARKDARVLMANLLQHATVIEMIEKLAPQF